VIHGTLQDTKASGRGVHKKGEDKTTRRRKTSEAEGGDYRRIQHSVRENEAGGGATSFDPKVLWGGVF